MTEFRIRDIIILGLMNFALFVGAGNIIFPPFIGFMAGTNVWIAGAGFLLTGVGLPVIASIAMARVGGVLPEITKPVGNVAGVILIIICYLCVGPLFATPRTATVSYEVAIKPFVGGEGYLWIYSLVFFSIAIIVSLYPHKLFDTVGKVLSPVKVGALVVLGITVFVLQSGNPGIPQKEFAVAPFSEGLSQGYLTMDTLAALVFGVVIVTAIRSRGITTPKLITRYAVYSGILAGLLLIFVYISLFRLGTDSTGLIENPATGADVLAAYVHAIYGSWGSVFLSVLITIACLVTAIGLTSSGSSYFHSLTGIDYRILVVIFGGLSMLISNIGLKQLIAISIPALEMIYPIFVVLIILAFIKFMFKSQSLVAIPACIVALAFGVAEAMKSIKLPENAGLTLADVYLDFYKSFWFEHQGLAWVVPCLSTIAIFGIIDAVFTKPRSDASA